MMALSSSSGSVPPAVLIGIPILAVGSVFLVSKVSGWSELSRGFCATAPFRGKSWKWRSARMRAYMGYNNCLTIGASPEGLYIACYLRLAHPPLFIPWHEISFVGEKSILFVPAVKLSLGREENVPFVILQTLAVELQAAAGVNWPVKNF